jgi:hypothetical protein
MPNRRNRSLGVERPLDGASDDEYIVTKVFVVTTPTGRFTNGTWYVYIYMGCGSVLGMCDHVNRRLGSLAPVPVEPAG